MPYFEVNTDIYRSDDGVDWGPGLLYFLYVQYFLRLTDRKGHTYYNSNF